MVIELLCFQFIPFCISAHCKDFYQYLEGVGARSLVPDSTISRYNAWIHKQRSGDTICYSHKYTHDSCVFGVLDLPYILKSPKLSVHKMYETFQPAAWACMQEIIYNRTYGLGKKQFGLLNSYEFYAEMPQVRFQNSGADDSFNCIS